MNVHHDISEVLSNIEVIQEIYQIVKDSANSTMKQLKDTNQELSVMMPYQKGINRAISECLQTTKCSIRYDPNHLTIIGSAAYAIYHSLFHNSHDNISPIKIKDIDINWWPILSSNDVVVTSKSKYIMQMISIFVNTLDMAFSTNHIMKQFIPHVENNTCSMMIRHYHTWKAGVFNIEILLKINNDIHKICDINVHDGGSSQRYDRNGEEIKELRCKEDDPTYCSPDMNYERSLCYVQIGNSEIAIPSMMSLVDQQLFAFENYVKQNHQKAWMYYERVERIRLALLKTEMKKEWMNAIGLQDEESVKYLIHEINIVLNQRIEKYGEKIINMNPNQENQFFYLTLMNRFIIIMEEYRNKQQVLYHNLMDMIQKKRMDARSILYKKKYIALSKEVEKHCEKIVNVMSMKDLIHYKIKDGLNQYVYYLHELEKMNVENDRHEREKERMRKERKKEVKVVES
jgi:hypothetical protein